VLISFVYFSIHLLLGFVHFFFCFCPVLLEELYFLHCISVFLVFYLFWYWRLTNKPDLLTLFVFSVFS